jgi:branched-chain amino acid transport system substrate-binding protein
MNKILQTKLLNLILLSVIVLIFISCQPNSSNIDNDITNRITLGEKSLAFNEKSFNPPREKAVRAIAGGQSDTAIKILTDYLKSKPNDPEARIFLNNLTVKDPYYTIAVSMPISSNMEGSLEVLRGVAHAQSDWNYSRLDDGGGMLKIAIANDDDNDSNNGTQIAQEVATELAKRKEILGVVGHYSSDASMATINIYEENKLVSISPVSTSVDLTKRTPYFFRTVPSDRAAAKALAKYAQGQLNSLKAVVFYNSDSNYSKSLGREFILELGNLNIIQPEDSDWDLAQWSEDIEDWGEKATNVLQKANRRGANLLMLVPSSGHLDKALEIVRANEGKLPIVAGDDMYSPKTLDKGQDNALEMVLAVGSDIEVNEGSEFPQRSEKLWGTSSVNWRTITAYDATLALGKAINDQTQPTREGVREKLSSPDFSVGGAIKKVKFSDTGDYDGDIQLVEVQKKGSGYDFAPIPHKEN